MSSMNEYKNFSMQFPRKGYGRIFVEKEEDVKKVEEIMRELDPDEFGWYYPTGEFLGGNHERLVTTFSKENFKSIYVGKFDDMDMGEVMKRACEKGIHCFVVFGKVNSTDGF